MKVKRIEISRPDVGYDRRHDMIAGDYTDVCIILHGVENEVFDTDEELADAIFLALSTVESG